MTFDKRAVQERSSFVFRLPSSILRPFQRNHTMTRLHQILIGLLAVQLILVGLVFFLPKSGQAAATPLLGATKAEDITSLVIQDDKGASIKLA